MTFAAKDCAVTIVDINEAAVARTNAGQVAFVERGTEELLRKYIGKNLRATTSPEGLRQSDTVVYVVGTPIDEHLNPQVGKLLQAVGHIQSHLHAGQLFVLRSTVYPGATALLVRWFESNVPGVDVAFCPERVAQGYAVEEIHNLPPRSSRGRRRGPRPAPASCSRGWRPRSSS